MKHSLHVGYLGHVPTPNRLVEVICKRKHSLHVGYLGNIPTSNRLVECMCMTKHTAHVGNLGNVPAGVWPFPTIARWAIISLRHFPPRSRCPMLCPYVWLRLHRLDWNLHDYPSFSAIFVRELWLNTIRRKKIPKPYCLLHK